MRPFVMSDSWPSQLITTLLEAPNYRSFLETYFTFRDEERTPPSLSKISRRAGFKSRSFLGDVIQERKRITPRSFPKICYGMDLSQLWRDYFYHLVSLDEKDVFEDTWDSEYIKDRIQKLASRIESELKGGDRDRANFIYRIRHAAKIYAALGDNERGASYRDILNRTRLRESELHDSIHKLEQVGLVKVDHENQRVFACDTHFIIDQIGRSSFFLNFYLSELESLRMRAQKRFDSDEELFFHSSFSINSKDMPKFKKELKGLLHSYIDKIEDPTGDRVSSIVLGFYL